MKANYYKLLIATDADQVGEWPQVEGFYDYSHPIDGDAYQKFDFRSDLLSIPSLDNFRLKDDAKRTDVIGNVFLTERAGLFVSDKLLRILGAFGVEISLPLEAMIHHREEVFRRSFLFFSEAVHALDFPKSVFEVNDVFPTDYSDTPLQFPDFDAYKAKWKEVVNGEGTNIIHPLRLVLKERVHLFRAPSAPDLLASEELKDKLEEEEITGLAFNDIDFEVVIQQDGTN
ncbi:MAG: hypothetical protein AAFV95_18810 [Bacteroidota bacterium]